MTVGVGVGVNVEVVVRVRLAVGVVVDVLVGDGETVFEGGEVVRMTGEAVKVLVAVGEGVGSKPRRGAAPTKINPKQ